MNEFFTNIQEKASWFLGTLIAILLIVLAVCVSINYRHTMAVIKNLGIAGGNLALILLVAALVLWALAAILKRVFGTRTPPPPGGGRP